MNNFLPLIDLHCHLDGSITPEIAKKLAELQDIALPCKNDEELLSILSVSENCENLNDFLRCFEIPLTLLQTPEGIEEAVYLVQENIRKQGVVYLEIRFAPQLHCKAGLTQKMVIEAALKGLERSSLHTNLILCCMRGKNNKKENLETVDLAEKFLVKDNGVVGLDLAGAEALFPTKDYAPLFEKINSKHIPFTIHAGEADGAESLRAALSFHAKRIGHGIRAWESPFITSEIKNNKIYLEFCPTSNRQTKAIENMDDYPVKEFLNKGIKVTINTDDMAICRTTLRDEFIYLEEQFNLSDEEEIQLLLNSAEAAFTTDETKEQLKNLIKAAC